VAKIRGINIVGAQAFSESELVSLFVLRTPGWLTWYTKHDRYAREKLSADLETLRSYYQNRGYLDFAIESTQVSITPDRHDIYITVNLNEGERYTVSDVQLSGQTPVPREQLEKLVQLKPGDVFSREKLAASTKAIGERLGNDGYAFANANAIPNVDKEKRTVAFNIVIDPGRRVYVRRIDVAGNSKTRDEVVRREMRQLEGAFYDASKFRKVSTDDFRQVMEAASESSLERFFERWIYQSGIPRVIFTYRLEPTAQGQDLVIHLEQTGELFDLPVTLTVQYADRRTRDIVVRLTDRTVDQRVPLDGRLRGVDVSRDDGTLAEIQKGY